MRSSLIMPRIPFFTTLVAAIVAKSMDWRAGRVVTGEERPLLTGDEESAPQEPVSATVEPAVRE